MKSACLCITAVFLTFTVQIESAKIAVPVFAGGASHFFMMEAIGQQLEARGHKVTYVMPSMEPKFEKIQVNSKIIYHTPKYPKGYFVQQTVGRTIKEGMSFGTILHAMEVLKDVCDSLLGNQELLQQLEGYDIVFADNSLFGCGNLLKEKVNISHIVDFSAWAFNDVYNWQLGIPWPVAYVPAEPITTNARKGVPFMLRVANTLSYVLVSIMGRYITNLICGSNKRKYNIAPDKSVSQLISETDLVLIPVDWTLEWPRPVPPNAKVIGPTTPKPSKKLPDDLEKFMQSASEGVILVSFGSMASSLDDRRAGILSKAFSMLKYKVLWKYKKTFPDVKNLKTVTWMPQNDILGHSRLKLFMTHSGLNSVYEAAYHGVPMLNTPLWGDQIGNAVKVKAAGFGESVNIKAGDDFTAEMISELINNILDNSKYKENAIRVSKLIRDRRQSPAEEAASWIEYVLRNNGTHHFQPYSTQLPFYQYFLLDVILLVFFVIFVKLYIICKICKFIKYLCCSSKSKQKVQ